jgi:hypothetical protein
MHAHALQCAVTRLQMERYKTARKSLGLPATERGDPTLEYAAGLHGLTPTQVTAACLDVVLLIRK